MDHHPHDILIDVITRHHKPPHVDHSLQVLPQSYWFMCGHPKKVPEIRGLSEGILLLPTLRLVQGAARKVCHQRSLSTITVLCCRQVHRPAALLHIHRAVSGRQLLLQVLRQLQAVPAEMRRGYVVYG